MAFYRTERPILIAQGIVAVRDRAVRECGVSSANRICLANKHGF